MLYSLIGPIQSRNLIRYQRLFDDLFNFFEKSLTVTPIVFLSMMSACLSSVEWAIFTKLQLGEGRMGRRLSYERLIR